MTSSNVYSVGVRRALARSSLIVRLAVILTVVLLATATPAADATWGWSWWSQGSQSSDVVVANRGSGDISVIDTRTLDVANIDLPGEAQPMYVNHDPRTDHVFIGDRASSSVVVLDDETYELVGTVPVGEGVFHQWVDSWRGQLWVVGDTSQTVTVVDTSSLEVITTIDMPQEVIDQNGKPHDVFVYGGMAYVTILGLDSGDGAILQYSARSFEGIRSVTVGDDPHVYAKYGKLYVASQETSTVAAFRAWDLSPIGELTVPSAHGIFVTDRSEVLVTNITGGGTDGIWNLNRRSISASDTDFATPHNITVDNRRQAFVTHSGAEANQVSILDLDRRSGFGSRTTVTVGTNPFGLAYVR